MKYIIATDKQTKILVDDEDYDWLSQFSWRVQLNGKGNTKYARCNSKKYLKKFMHRIITNAKIDQEVDHINRNGLDNRRNNLRLVNRTQNNRNVGIKKTNTSGYKGVYFNKSMKKYMALITVNRKRVYLGCYESKQEAAKVYNIKAKQEYGEYAYLNNILYDVV